MDITPRFTVDSTSEYAESVPTRGRGNTMDSTPKFTVGSTSEYTGRSAERVRSDLTFDSTLTAHDRIAQYPLSTRRTTVSSNYTLYSEDNTLAGSEYGGRYPHGSHCGRGN
jgi:hypothetical protein